MALHATESEGEHKMVLEIADVSYINSAGPRTMADGQTWPLRTDRPVAT